MSTTINGHRIYTIKGDDYVTLEDYVKVEEKIIKTIEYIENKKDFFSNGYYLKKGRENELLDYILSILRGEDNE